MSIVSTLLLISTLYSVYCTSENSGIKVPCLIAKVSKFAFAFSMSSVFVT